MLDFLSNNISTVIVSAIIALWLILAVIKMISDKKNGKVSCSNCPHRGACHMASGECREQSTKNQ